MAIFETLYLSFKADSSQLKKEVDDVNKKTKETTDTFKKAEEQTKKSDNEFQNMAKSLSKLAVTYFGVSSVINGFKSSFAHTTELAKFSRDVNVNIGTLDAWGKAFKNFGGDEQSFRSSISAVSSKFNDVAPQFILDYLPDLGDQLKRIRNAFGVNRAQSYGQEIGLDPTLVSFLLQSRKVIEEAIRVQRDIGVVTEQDAERIRQHNSAVGKLKDSFDQLYRTLSVFVLPVLDSLVKSITYFVGIINSVVDEFVNAFSEFFDAINVFSTGDEEKKKKSLLDPNNDLDKITDIVKKDYSGSKIEELLNSDFFQWFFGSSSANTASNSGAYLVPTSSHQVTNSQARNLNIGTMNVTSNASDPQAVANATVAQINSKSEFLSQLQQANSFSDNAVVI